MKESKYSLYDLQEALLFMEDDYENIVHQETIIGLLREEIAKREPTAS